MNSYYEDIKTIISRIDSIWNEPDHQPFPEADEFDLKEDEVFEEVLGGIRISRRRTMGSRI